MKQYYQREAMVLPDEYIERAMELLEAIKNKEWSDYDSLPQAFDLHLELILHYRKSLKEELAILEQQNHPSFHKKPCAKPCW